MRSTKNEDAAALSRIVRFSPIPVIADIHFNASLALKAIDAGVAAVGINPGNIGGPDKVEKVVAAAKRARIRCGSANSGSLPKHLQELAQRDQAEALVAAAIEELDLLERLDYHDFKISVKATHVPTMIRAYRILAARVIHPLPLGRGRRRGRLSPAIKSAVGIGSLLADGIGDTLARLADRGSREGGRGRMGDPEGAGPARARPDHDRLLPLVRPRQRRRREARRPRGGAAQGCPQAFEVAVMGCAVNGPGEAGDADFGIAGGRDVGFVYAHGRVLKKIVVGHPRRRAVPRDRPVDRGRHAPPQAAEDGEAGGASHGRGVGHSTRLAAVASLLPVALTGQRHVRPTSSCRPSATLPPTRRPSATKLLVRGGATSVKGRRRVDVPPARLARPPEHRPDHPRGDGCDRRAGDARCRS